MKETTSRNIDRYFSEFILSLEENPSEIIRTAAYMASEAVGRKESCVTLKEIEDVLGSPLTPSDLKRFKSVGEAGDYKPLIVDDDRLYLYRYWRYENDLATSLADMASTRFDCDNSFIKGELDRLFGTLESEADWQRIAAAAAAENGLTVISGGPGTGKTTTVFRIILLLLEMHKNKRFRIALAAPTGKAAARLKETLAGAAAYSDVSKDSLNQLPQDVSTIHRLLGYLPDNSSFRFNASNKLPFEAVIIDEASMVSLPLMAKLCEALPSGCRLILLGDKNQLSSVDAGGVLGDLCADSDNELFSRDFCDYIHKTCGVSLDSAETDSTFSDSIITLKKNYRFESSGNIADVSRGITSGMANQTLDGLKTGSFSRVTLLDSPDTDKVKCELKSVVCEQYSQYLSATSPLEMISMFDRFRILSPLRNGDYGVTRLSRLSEEILAENGMIDAEKSWYHGRPVMVTVNDYTQRLFNGDVGIVCRDSSSETGFTVFFRTPEGSLKGISPTVMPEHETVYAMTVHKSQGSEFDTVLLVMPKEDSPILTREIMYTGLTRGKKEAQIWCSDEIFLSTVNRRTLRNGGLRTRFTSK